jgi:hypothetical protein
MAHFLLIYDRSAGVLIRQQEFRSSLDAMNARFAAETEYEQRSDVEVVAIDARSEADLHRSHGRYFYSLAELADRIG